MPYNIQRRRVLKKMFSYSEESTIQEHERPLRKERGGAQESLRVSRRGRKLTGNTSECFKISSYCLRVKQIASCTGDAQRISEYSKYRPK